MPLTLHSRQVGHITVLSCSGRLIEGEVAALQDRLQALLPHAPWIVLDVGDVAFIDSSGIGLLVRFVVRARRESGDLKVCAVPPKVADVLRVTKLGRVFDVHPSPAEAIAAFYHRTDSTGLFDRAETDLLCVDPSVNVLAYVCALLRQAGYGVLTASNLPDGLILLQATRPKLVVIAATLRAARSTRTAESFHRLADTTGVIELPADFSSREAGDAGFELLTQVQARLGGRDAVTAE